MLHCTIWKHRRNDLQGKSDLTQVKSDLTKDAPGSPTALWLEAVQRVGQRCGLSPAEYAGHNVAKERADWECAKDTNLFQPVDNLSSSLQSVFVQQFISIPSHMRRAACRSVLRRRAFALFASDFICYVARAINGVRPLFRIRFRGRHGQFEPDALSRHSRARRIAVDLLLSGDRIHFC